MKNNLFFLLIFLILNNCGGFEFVYKTNINMFFIKNDTEIVVDGDGSSQIRVALKNIIGIIYIKIHNHI